MTCQCQNNDVGSASGTRHFRFIAISDHIGLTKQILTDYPGTVTGIRMRGIILPSIKVPICILLPFILAFFAHYKAVFYVKCILCMLFSIRVTIF